MSSTVNLSELFKSPSVNGTYSTTPINKLVRTKDGLYEPYNTVYGDDKIRDLPLEVKEYLLQVKSYSDALSSSLVSLMLKAIDNPDSEAGGERAAAEPSGETETVSGTAGDENSAGGMTAAKTQTLPSAENNNTSVRTSAAENTARRPETEDEESRADDKNRVEQAEKTDNTVMAQAEENIHAIAVQAEEENNAVNIDEVKDSLRTLVDSYNALLEFSSDFEKDPGFDKLHNRLTTLLDAYGQTLGEAGIYITDNGALALDDTRIDRAISDGRVSELFSESRDNAPNGASFGRAAAALSEKGLSEPFAYMNDGPSHRVGGDKTGREYLKIMDTYNSKGMIFDTTQ